MGLIDATRRCFRRWRPTDEKLPAAGADRPDWPPLARPLPPPPPPPPAPQYRIEDVLTAAQTLTVRPGDIVAILHPRRLSYAEDRAIRDAAERVFSERDVKVIVLQEGMALARVTVEEPNGTPH